MIPQEQAIEEFERWFEAKKLPKSYRENYEDQEKVIIEAMTDGYLVLSEDEKGNPVFVHSLLFPIKGGQIELESLTYAFRINTGKKSAALRGVKSNDTYGMLGAIVSALTGESRAIIGALDTVDSAIAHAIAIYFL